MPISALTVSPTTRRNNEFLASWTDTRDSLHNVGIMGRIVKADGSMPAARFYPG